MCTRQMFVYFAKKNLSSVPCSVPLIFSLPNLVTPLGLPNLKAASILLRSRTNIISSNRSMHNDLKENVHLVNLISLWPLFYLWSHYVMDSFWSTKLTFLLTVNISLLPIMHIILHIEAIFTSENNIFICEKTNIAMVT